MAFRPIQFLLCMFHRQVGPRRPGAVRVARREFDPLDVRLPVVEGVGDVGRAELALGDEIAGASRIGPTTGVDQPLPPRDQRLNVDIQRVGDPCQHDNRRIAFPAFNPGKVRLVHQRAMRQFLLRETPGAPQRLQVQPDSLTHIHRGMARRDLTSAHRL